MQNGGAEVWVGAVFEFVGGQAPNVHSLAVSDVVSMFRHKCFRILLSVINYLPAMSDTDVRQLVVLALAEFGYDWHDDNVTYMWLHTNWRQTRDRPRPTGAWGKQIRKLEHDVRTALTAERPPPDPMPAARHRSRSPHRDPQVHQLEVPQASQVLAAVVQRDTHQKQAIVDRLMANTAAQLSAGDHENWIPKAHVPMATIDARPL